MNLDPERPIARNYHIKTLLRRRDHLKKVGFERLLQGQDIKYCLEEIGALNSIINELLALRAALRAPGADNVPADGAAGPDPIEVDTLSREEVLAVIDSGKDSPIKMKQSRRIRFLPTAEVRLTRTTLQQADVVEIGLWKSQAATDVWSRTGHIRIPGEGFSALLQELNNLEISPVAADPLDIG